jgi:hypothetical protein
MSRKDKRADDVTMSFFSFQDIICCVTGILIFITLMVSVDLVNAGGPKGSLEEAALESKITLSSAKRRLTRLKSEYDVIVENQQQLKGEPITQARIDEMSKKLEELEKTRRFVTQQKNYDKIQGAQLAEQIRDAKKRNEDLQKQLLTLTQAVARDENRMAINIPAGNEKNLKPIFLELSSNAITIADFDDNGDIRQIKRFPGANAMLEAVAWTDSRDIKTDYLVILVRPDAIELFSPLRRELRNRNFTVGWEAWPLSKSLFSKKQEKPVKPEADNGS